MRIGDKALLLKGFKGFLYKFGIKYTPNFNIFRRVVNNSLVFQSCFVLKSKFSKEIWRINIIKIAFCLNFIDI